MAMKGETFTTRKNEDSSKEKRKAMWDIDYLARNIFSYDVKGHYYGLIITTQVMTQSLVHKMA